MPLGPQNHGQKRSSIMTETFLLTILSLILRVTLLFFTAIGAVLISCPYSYRCLGFYVLWERSWNLGTSFVSGFLDFLVRIIINFMGEGSKIRLASNQDIVYDMFNCYLRLSDYFILYFWLSLSLSSIDKIIMQSLEAIYWTKRAS